MGSITAVSAYSPPERPGTPGLRSFRNDDGELLAVASSWVTPSPDPNRLSPTQIITGCKIRTARPWFNRNDNWQETDLTLDGQRRRVWVDLASLCTQRGISREEAIALCEKGMLSCEVRCYEAMASLLHKNTRNFFSLEKIQNEARNALKSRALLSSRLHGYVIREEQYPIGEGATKQAIAIRALGSGASLVGLIPTNKPSIEPAALARSLDRYEKLMTACLKSPKLAAVCTLPIGPLQHQQSYCAIYEKGISLSQYVENQLSPKLDMETKIDLTRQLLSAVQIIHEHNFTHLDIKPDNLLIFPGLVLKLADFDFAVWSHESCGVLGTDKYLDPDLLDKENSTNWTHERRKKSDLFSTGMTLCKIFFPRILENACCSASLDIRCTAIFDDVKYILRIKNSITLSKQAELVAADIICGLLQEETSRWSIEQVLYKCTQFPLFAEPAEEPVNASQAASVS